MVLKRNFFSWSRRFGRPRRRTLWICVMFIGRKASYMTSKMSFFASGFLQTIRTPFPAISSACFCHFWCIAMADLLICCCCGGGCFLLFCCCPLPPPPAAMVLPGHGVMAVVVAAAAAPLLPLQLLCTAPGKGVMVLVLLFMSLFTTLGLAVVPPSPLFGFDANLTNGSGILTDFGFFEHSAASVSICNLVKFDDGI